ncbi:5694_t:CDS:2 [Racocetra persica]|uniref:5694_t:CDS:1 n=1 Tax=Racocetra persica TaxID=160502 RepID=A0ACA9P5C1_9GLOM|nr:5694_t:CDS:2 [Racocetra persica]
MPQPKVTFVELPFKKRTKNYLKRASENLFNNAKIASLTQSMLVYEQQNNKFGEIKSFVRLLEDLNMLEKETNPEANGIPGQSDALDFSTGDIGFNIAKAFLKYGYKKYVISIKVIRHANSEYLEEEKLKRENRAKTLAEEGVNVELVDYNKHDELVKALTGASFVVSALERFVPSEFYVDYKSITEDSIKLIPKPFWYTFENKKDFQEVLEKRKVVKKTEIMELSRVKLDYFYLYAGLAYEYLAWLGFDTTTRDANFYAERDKKVSLTSLAYWQICCRTDKEWSDIYPFEDLNNLNAHDHEEIKVVQARNLDLDRVIEIFVRTNAKEQLDLSHIHEFPELLNDLK